MTLPLPQLDKRNWSDLLAEGLARIPRRAPDWTDHNLHDPGITLLELLAYKTEQLLFQSNRISQRLLENVYSLLDAKQPNASTSVLWFSQVTKLNNINVGEIYKQQLVGDEPYSFVPRVLRIAEWDKSLNSTKRKTIDQVYFKHIGLIPFNSISIFTFDERGERNVTQQLYAGHGFSCTPEMLASQIGRTSAAKVTEGKNEVPFKYTLFTIKLFRPIKRSQRKKNLETNIHEASEEEMKKTSNFGIFFEIESDGSRKHDFSEEQKSDGSGLRWYCDNETEPSTVLLDETRDLSQSGIVRLLLKSDVSTIRCEWAGKFPWPAHRLIRRVVPNAVRAEHALPFRNAGMDDNEQPLGDGNESNVRFSTDKLVTDRNGFKSFAWTSPCIELSVRVGETPNSAKVWGACQSLLEKNCEEECFEFDGLRIRFGNGKYGKELPENGYLYFTGKVLQQTQGISIGTKWQRLHSTSINNGQVCQDQLGSNEIEVLTIEVPGTSTVDDVYSRIQQQANRLNASHGLRLLAERNEGTLDGLPRNKILAKIAPEVAVTSLDYERLALETPRVRIMRARAFPEIDVKAPGLPGHGTVSVIVLPDLYLSGLWNDNLSQEDIEYCVSLFNGKKMKETPREFTKRIERKFEKCCVSSIEFVESYLSVRQSMGGRLVVSSPKLSLVAIRLSCTASKGEAKSDERELEVIPEKLEYALSAYLSPYTGGPNGTGLAWGKPITQGEITALLNDTLRSIDADREVTVRCEVQQLTKCFPWSMPLAVIIKDPTGKKAGEA